MQITTKQFAIKHKPNKDIVQDLYATGKTQKEIAQLFGVHQVTISKWMRKLGIGVRENWRSLINQTGSNNHSWIGNQAGYYRWHKRFGKILGKPNKCEVCGSTNPNKRYEWASITGKYDSPDDYLRMCVACHRRYDSNKRKQCKHGHLRSDENTYIYKGSRNCKVCKNLRKKKYQNNAKD